MTKILFWRSEPKAILRPPISEMNIVLVQFLSTVIHLPINGKEDLFLLFFIQEEVTIVSVCATVDL